MIKLSDIILKEVSDSDYNKILSEYKNSRIIMTKNDNIVFQNKTQPIDYKPVGLWYGIGPSWINWVRSEMPRWESNNVFLLNIDESKVLIIRNREELDDFHNQYNVDNEKIDWTEVSKLYSGIEIAPYIYSARMKIFWYYTWDIASGCIWDKKAIQSISRI